MLHGKATVDNRMRAEGRPETEPPEVCNFVLIILFSLDHFLHQYSDSETVAPSTGMESFHRDNHVREAVQDKQPSPHFSQSGHSPKACSHPGATAIKQTVSSQAMTH